MYSITLEFITLEEEYLMNTPRVTESEFRLCLILWEHQPMKSSELVRRCQDKLGWKETTTYTVIKRLSDRGVVKNEKTIVTALVSKDEVQAAELNHLLEKTFEGSLPAFISAFTNSQQLTEQEVDALQVILDRYRKEHPHE